MLTRTSVASAAPVTKSPSNEKQSSFKRLVFACRAVASRALPAALSPQFYLLPRAIYSSPYL